MYSSFCQEHHRSENVRGLTSVYGTSLNQKGSCFRFLYSIERSNSHTQEKFFHLFNNEHYTYIQFDSNNTLFVKINFSYIFFIVLEEKKATSVQRF